MTQFLPPNLLALFAPRDPLPFLPPSDKLPHEKKTRGYVGVGNFLDCFEVSVYTSEMLAKLFIHHFYLPQTGSK
jgi:U1 small nuclear ribonucleoprotein of 70kDa MW N terminal